MNAPFRKALTGSDALALISREIDRFEPRIARALRNGFETARNRLSAQELATMIAARDIDAIFRAYGDNIPTTAFEDFRRVVERATIAGGRITAEQQGRIEGVREDFVIEVGQTNPKLANYANEITSTRIREIDNGTRDLIRSILRDGTVQGDDPFAIARRVRTSIGLTTRQEAAVNAYRRNLEQLDPYALQRELRDKRSDRTVDRAIRNETPLSRAQIESLVDRYRARWINYRSKVIGRTESVRAVQGAQWELFEQLIEDGKIDVRQVRREWFTTPDDRLRDAHAAIPGMNEDGVGQREPFQSPLGPIMYPGDPNAPAENTIQCRCAVFAEIVSAELLGLRDRPGSSPPPAPQPPDLVSPEEAGRREALQRLRDLSIMGGQARAHEAFDGANLTALTAMSRGGDLSKFTVGERDRKGRLNGSYAGFRDNVNMHPDRTGEAYERVLRHEFGHILDDRMAKAQPGLTPLQRRDAQFRAFSAVEELNEDTLALERTRTGIFGWEKPSETLQRQIDKNRDEYVARNRVIFNELQEEDVSERLTRDTGISAAEWARMMEVNEDEITRPLFAAQLISAWERRDPCKLLYDAPIAAGTRFTHNSAFAGMQDTFEAGTGGNIRIQFGHGKSYYTGNNRYERSQGRSRRLGRRTFNGYNTAQAFANWFEAYTSKNPADYRLFRHMWPKTSARFEELVLEYLELTT